MNDARIRPGVSARLNEWRLARTDAGRHEIRARELPLSRPARNLLLIIDPGYDAAHWLDMVQGSRPEDLQALAEAGLVALAPSPTDSQLPLDSRLPDIDAGPSTLSPALEAYRQQAAQVLEAVPYGELYDRLMAEVKPRLGLIKAYRTTLAIERATDVVTLREAALEFLAVIRRAQGEAGAREVLRALVKGTRADTD